MGEHWGLKETLGQYRNDPLHIFKMGLYHLLAWENHGAQYHSPLKIHLSSLHRIMMTKKDVHLCPLGVQFNLSQ